LNKYIFILQAASITEAKLKMSDINCAVHICGIMHQRYAEFAPSLLENWQKYFPTKKDEKVKNLHILLKINKMIFFFSISYRGGAGWSGSMLVANPLCWFCLDAAQMINSY
jgi:hypothetical protein